MLPTMCCCTLLYAIPVALCTRGPILEQLFPQHFRKTHKFRLEWQPGRDGRIDWYGQVPSKDDAAPPEWIHGYTIHDEFVRNQTGAQIPAEPSYLIMNIALSSNWGFPYDIKPTCKRCYDCDNPRCACALQPGFCDMMRSGNADMLIDSVRVYQNDDDSAHVGEPHTLGCDPPNYPTREFIAGHSYRYMRRWPGYDDRKPMKKIVVGGGSCEDDADCGTLHRGQCVPDAYRGLFAARGSKSRNTCVCEDGFVGPRCLTISYKDDAPGAYEIKQEQNSLATVAEVYLPMPLLLSFLCIVIMFTASMAWQIYCRKMPIKYNKDGDIIPMSPFLKRPQFRPTGDENDDERVTLITGRSV
uniref:EGF-like domain-containing protein n=1 Tax=Corethron hystrix TaxID=216773 RepID=A0A7S1BGP4_9STRA|mmetsp:Transcript_27419/g.62969  ORF Transcript_27419/g.62969 Transcript_27419/m.62969 type:complete len:356 (+) Transcript_27419:226-1293(+)